MAGAGVAGRSSVPSGLGRFGAGLVEPVGGQHLVGGGVAQEVEPAAAAGAVHPALGEGALGVVAVEDVLGPLFVGEIRGVLRIGDVGLSSVVVLGLVPRT